MNPYPTALDTIQDGHQVTAAVTAHKSNPWSPRNMHGNDAGKRTKVIKNHGQSRKLPFLKTIVINFPKAKAANSSEHLHR